MSYDVPTIEVEDLSKMLTEATKPYVIDVREKWENDLCNIKDSHLIPLAMLPNSLNALPHDQPIVVHCHHGGRSAKAVSYLQTQGFSQAVNLKGGIHAWAQRIDRTMKTYE